MSFGLASGDVAVELGAGTRLQAEWARSDSASVTSGDAVRVALQHSSQRGSFRAFYLESDSSFYNPSAGLYSGRRELGFTGRANLDTSTGIFAEALRSEDLTTGSVRRGGQLAIERRLRPWLDVDLGYRQTTFTEGDSGDSDVGDSQTTSFRTRLTARPDVAGRPSLFGEYEQAFADSGKRRVALGGDLSLFDRARLYARHELISSLAGPYALVPDQDRNRTVFGLSADYSDRSQIFSEYRVRDAASGREAMASIGLRNQWSLGDGIQANTSFERLSPVSGEGRSALAVTGALDFTGSPLWKGSTRLEYRGADGSDQVLGTLGYIRKVSRDLSFIGQSALSWQNSSGAAYERTRLGLAYRSTENSRLNALGRYEHNWQRQSGTNGSSSHGAHVLSGHANLQVNPAFVLRGQLAAKVANETDTYGGTTRQTGTLLGVRATKDLTNRLDVGAVGRTLSAGGARTFGLGLEAGLLFGGNLRLGVGYNVFGFSDADLGADEYTDHGFYVDFGLTFDERLFGLGSTLLGGRR
ncbi:MAG: hypothetical protein GWP44_13580 [Proteobacteria bacterium]|nr:hypothetical protein [Pseudomonadota bacterium]